MLYGGGISYSGSTIFVKAGSGIINNMNASSGSEINPIITYVTWNDYTSSATYLTSSQNTYLYVDANGSIFQQTSFFNQTLYEQALPLGRVTHPNYVSITGYGSNVQTTYDSDTQQNDFIRAFGPLKVSGFSITPQTGTLRLGIGSGIAYNLGGFYTQDPNSPSHYESAGFATASIARAWRSGSGVYLDNNGGAFYTTVDTDYWDDGTGVLNTMNAGDWQIQRVFANPVTGRAVVYYGQNVYTNLLNALQYLATDSFEEGEFTAKSLVFVGYLVLKGQTSSLTDTANNRIINAGIFRNIAGGSAGGGAVAQILNDLSDVIITTPTNYQALVYDGGNWINSSFINASISGNAGTATTASYALTASHVNTLTQDVSITGDLVVGGRITAEEFHTEFVSASIIYQSGSTKFGNSSDDVHSFTGSLYTTGKVNIGTVDNFGSDPDKFLALTGAEVVYRTGAQLLSDIGGQTAGTFVQNDGSGGQARYIMRYADSNSATTSSIYEDTSGNIGIKKITPSAALDINGSAIVSGSLTIQGTTAVVQQGILVSGTTSLTVASISTGSYEGAFLDYTIVSGSNRRAGTLATVWTPSDIEWNDVSTLDLGSTVGAEFTPTLAGSNANLVLAVPAGTWTVKGHLRYM